MSSDNGRQLVKSFLKENDINIKDVAKMYGLTKQEVSNCLNGIKKGPASNRLVLQIIHDLNI